MESQYPSHIYMLEFSDTISNFLPNELPEGLKKKREDQIGLAYIEPYDIQIGVAGVVKKIQISHLLGMNEIVVPHLSEEYGQLIHGVRMLEAALKPMKSFQELKSPLGKLNAFLTPKKLPKMLFDDLAHLAETHAFEIDIKTAVNVAKNTPLDKDLKAKLGGKKS